MAVNWYVDEGLNKLASEWRKEHPDATVYFIGDTSHNPDPDKSQHAPDTGGSEPGDDKGEVDGADFMPGKGVSDSDLDELAEGLRKSKDKRILIVIRRQRIFSSYPHGEYDAFEWRAYSGAYHGHTHVSVNDDYDNNTSDWKWEKLVARTIENFEIEGKLPLLFKGDEDVKGSWASVARAQALMNFLDGSVPDLDTDGVYGSKTAAKMAAVMKAAGVTGTTGNGSKIGEAEWRRLIGLSK